MLAVANGAWLLSPAWVTASLEAGSWLPESAFPAQVLAREGGKGLSGLCLCWCVWEAGGGGAFFWQRAC